MIDASCHCGAIRFAAEAAPTEVNDCDCSICRRYGALWAYYHPSQVQFAAGSGATEVYMWGERRLEFHRCRTCGCVTHWSAVDKTWPRMGVNARMMPPEVLVSVPVLRNGVPLIATRPEALTVCAHPSKHAFDIRLPEVLPDIEQPAPMLLRHLIGKAIPEIQRGG